MPFPSRLNLARAELYLCLSRAFLPPTEATAFACLQDELTADLEELLPEEPRVADLRHALGACSSSLTLLRAYSRLFLTPAVPAPLNAGEHLDGAPMGPTVQRLQALFDEYGLGISDRRRQGPDHLSTLLELLAVFLVEAAMADDGEDERWLTVARNLLRDFIAPWLPAWTRAIGDTVQLNGLSDVYLHLAHLCNDYVMADLRRLADRLPYPVPAAAVADRSVTPVSIDDDTLIHCRRCNDPFAPGTGIREMIERLSASGLSVEHLATCPDCRGPEMGLAAMQIPQMGKRT